MSNHLPRRQFLQLLILTGAAAGCRRVATTSPSGASTALPVTLTLDLRYVLQNAAIDYEPHPRGCDVTSLRGSVRAADGSPVAGIAVRVWADDPAQALTLITDSGGYYSVDLAGALSDSLYHVQLVDQARTTLYSDVVVAQAISSCDLNMMTVNFVATR